MNNATRPDSIHPYTLPQDDPDQDNPGNPRREDPSNAEQKEISEVLHRLDRIRFTPRAATIRAVMKYARERNKAVH